jgi:hypothetical protein
MSDKRSNIREELSKLGLDSSNSIVIGSGILQAVGIRGSKDIDLVVIKEKYKRLKKDGRFIARQTKYKRETLEDDLFEIGTNWNVLGKSYKFGDFDGDSVMIDGVRYITLDFLYEAKKSWLDAGTARPKDVEDLKLIEEYKGLKENE